MVIMSDQLNLYHWLIVTSQFSTRQTATHYSKLRFCDSKNLQIIKTSALNAKYAYMLLDVIILIHTKIMCKCVFVCVI